MLRRLFRKIGLTAHRCPACSKVVHAPEASLCRNCTKAMQPRIGGYCPTCGKMSGRELDPPTRCPDCRHEPPPWGRLHFHGEYAGPLRELILAYKFSGFYGHTRLLANMADYAFHTDGICAPDIIIPVPLHRKRLLWRGFNQSSEIANILSKKLDIPILGHGLSRTRNTPPQTRLGHEERQANIKDAFAADPAHVNNKRVLLVDDVYTTGATLRECTRTLLRAGAAGVDVLVLARAP